MIATNLNDAPLNNNEVRIIIKKFKYHQRNIEYIAKKNTSACELLTLNPILLWLTVDWALLNNIPISRLYDLMNGKQEVVLRAQLPIASKSHVKFLKKLSSLSCFTKNLVGLIHTVYENTPVFNALRHVDLINDDLVGFLGGLNFYKEEETKLAVLVCRYFQNNQLISCVEILNVYHGIKVLNYYFDSHHSSHSNKNYMNSIPTLFRVYNELLDKYKNIKSSGKNSLPDFYIPFIIGNKHISHIKSYEELILEGYEMQSCVGMHSSEIYLGVSCVYKVFYPERGTLELREYKGAIVIYQFKCKYNREPSYESIQFVSRWVDSHGLNNNLGSEHDDPSKYNLIEWEQ